ncbi:MAG: tetratricopeptide repeat protein [Leptolyngbya sp. SIOISBB]|nr:tetratricopeptide repeat protein [Leptolyngbya sp. SIOISBB]
MAEQSLAAKQALPKLSSLDDRLRQQSQVIAQMVPLEQWREIVAPLDSAWWWQLEKVHPWAKLDWLWKLLTVPILTLNFALVVAISSRFLAGGPDAIGAFAVLGQSLVAMFAAGAPLTKSGQQIIERSLKALRLPKYLWYEAKLAIAVIIFLALLGFQSSLPTISASYVRRGTAAQSAQQTTSAAAQYQRAIKLNPNNMEAHFRLGTVYEDLLDIDQAREEYRIAMLGGCIEAYNNLARLYIVNDQDYVAARTLLRQGQSQLENRDSTEVTYCSQAAQDNLVALEYTFFTNLGWAHLRLDNLPDSESQLREAIKLNEEGAAPHCLLAQVLERQEEKDLRAAIPEWNKCFEYARTLNPDEEQWLDMAQQRLSQWESD